MDELIRKSIFISIIIIYLFTIIMYNYKTKPINDQVLIISLVSTIILLLILLVSYKVFPKKVVKENQRK
jgi:RsiW-degrading membrane proteinase PrsW (M82 family)